MIDKEKAAQLRKEGLTYPQIAEVLGCSVGWCKKNLNGIMTNEEEESERFLEKCLNIAKAPAGITTSQILKIVMKPEDYEKTGTELKDFRKAILRKYKSSIKANGGIVRPSWMVPSRAHDSFKKLIEIVNELDERVYDYVLDFREEFGLDASHDKAIMFGIHQLCSVGLTMSTDVDVHSICESFTKIANALENKNGVNLKRLSSQITTTSMTDLGDDLKLVL